MAVVGALPPDGDEVKRRDRGDVHGIVAGHAGRGVAEIIKGWRSGHAGGGEAASGHAPFPSRVATVARYFSSLPTGARGWR